MIARQSNRVTRFRLTCLAGALAGVLPVIAVAEQMPWEEAPVDEPSLWNDPTFDGTSTAVPDAGAEDTAPPATPVDTGPDIPAPKVDAYFDVSFNDSDLDAFGYASSSSGYRFVAGFEFQELGSERVTVAPEVGYYRMNTAERNAVTVDANNSSLPTYIVTTTRRYTTDISSLDFGARFGFRFNDRISAFARAGLGFFHLADKLETMRSYTPKPGNPTPKADDFLLPDSSSEAGISPYLALGASFMLGPVPTVYVEYGTRRIDGELVNSASLGFLLNF